MPKTYFCWGGQGTVHIQAIAEIRVNGSCRDWECRSLIEHSPSMYNLGSVPFTERKAVLEKKKVLFCIFPPLPYESSFIYLGIANIKKILKGPSSLKSSYSIFWTYSHIPSSPCNHLPFPSHQTEFSPCPNLVQFVSMSPPVPDACHMGFNVGLVECGLDCFGPILSWIEHQPYKQFPNR